MEVARGAAVTGGPLEARPAGAPARVSVAVAVQHSGAGTPACCGRGGQRGQSGADGPRPQGRGQGQGRGRGGAGRDSRWQSGPWKPGAHSSQWSPWKPGLHRQRPARASRWQALSWVPAALQSQSADGGQAGRGGGAQEPCRPGPPPHRPPCVTTTSPGTFPRHSSRRPVGTRPAGGRQGGGRDA